MNTYNLTVHDARGGSVFIPHDLIYNAFLHFTKLVLSVICSGTLHCAVQNYQLFNFVCSVIQDMVVRSSVQLVFRDGSLAVNVVVQIHTHAWVMANVMQTTWLKILMFTVIKHWLNIYFSIK